jgi:group I intron endonuclease
MAVGVYKITNPKGAIYIGSSKDIKKRWMGYNRLSEKSQFKLYNSFIKYGVDKHLFEIIEICEIKDLLKLEHIHSVNLNVLDRSNLNLRIPKYLDSVTHFSEETLLKMRNAKLGKISKKKGVPLPIDVRLNMSASKKGKASNRRKLILDNYTGIFYNSIGEAAKSIDMNRTTLNEMLVGRNKNRTNFIYAK